MQMGFMLRIGRSDAIFTIKLMMEKYEVSAEKLYKEFVFSKRLLNVSQEK